MLELAFSGILDNLGLIEVIRAYKQNYKLGFIHIEHLLYH